MRVYVRVVLTCAFGAETVYMLACVCMWMHACLCLYTSVHTCVHVYACIGVHVCLRLHRCVHSRCTAGCTLGKRRLGVESQALFQVFYWPQM